MHYEISEHDWTFSSFVSFVTLLISSSDNKVSKEEINTIKYNFVNHPTLNKSAALLRLPEMAKLIDQGDFKFSKAYEDFKSKLSSDELKQGLKIGIEVAMVDSTLTSSEKYQLYKISSNCGFDRSFIDTILSELSFKEVEVKNYSRSHIFEMYESSVKKSELNPIPYHPEAQLKVNDLVEHEEYGVGFVQAALSDTVVAVVFEDEIIPLEFGKSVKRAA